MRYLSTSLFFVMVWAISSSSALGQTYVVGTCMTGAKSFATISAAVAAAPANSTVDVCPGSYPEQVTISKPLTLQGVTSGNQGVADIVVPGGGLTLNATSIFGNSVAAQVLVTGNPVDISNVTVDGTNSLVEATSSIVGIFYESGSSGRINQAQVFGQQENNNGTGIWVENGSTVQESVTIENSVVGGADRRAIFFGSDVTPSTLTVTLTGNVVSVNGRVGPHGCAPVTGITAQATGTLTGNTISSANCGAGIVVNSPVSIENNTISSSGGGGAPTSEEGILLSTSSATIQSNTFFPGGFGPALRLSRATNATIQSNNIVGGSPAVDFACHTAAISNNTISSAGVGLANVPSSVTSTNVMYNVVTLRTACTKPVAPSVTSAAPRSN